MLKVPDFTICATLTKDSVSSFEEWFKSVEGAVTNDNSEILIAASRGYIQSNLSLIQNSALQVEIVTTGSSFPAKLWTKVLRSACARQSKYLVFADIGSALECSALSNYQETLEIADFTYGDVRYADQNDDDNPPTLFTDAAVAEEIKRIEQLFDRNWLSFTNTAMRRKSLQEAFINIPDNIIAPAWWFFSSLVRGGQKGIATDSITTTILESSVETIRPSRKIDYAQMLKRCETTLRHYQAFAACDDLMKNRAKSLKNLMEAMSSAPKNFTASIARAEQNAKLWYEDVGFLLTSGDEVQKKTAPLALLKYSQPDTFATRTTIIKELYDIGIAEGDILIPHISLKSIGYVIGGTRTVLDALYGAVGDSGTIVMPAFSGELTDPSTWFKPPVPKKWHEKIRDDMPPFDPKRTPSAHIGAAAELFRNEPGTLRSNHPVSSFAARGAHASEIIAEHPLDCRFGLKSPLGKMRDLGGKALLIGAPFEHLTILHLTSFELGNGVKIAQKSPILSKGKKKWVSYTDISVTGFWFKDAINHLIEKGVAKIGKVHNARTLLVSIPEAVEATVAWRKKNKV